MSEPIDREVEDFIHERLRWMAFLAGWMAGRPGEMADVGDVHRAYLAWDASADRSLREPDESPAND